MDNQSRVTRRDALRHLLVLSAVVAAPGALAACTKKDEALACTDTTGLTPDELTMRTQTLAYSDASTDPTKKCSGCQLFKPAAAANQCGSCTLIKGSINPNGSCKSFVAKPA